MVNFTHYLWKKLDGTLVVTSLVPTGIPGHFDVNFRPADEEDMMTYEFLKPEHDQ